MTELRFPAGFLWGTSTSPHQVEGNNANNDWWRWEQQPGRIRDASRSGDAAGWWAGAAEADLALAAAHHQSAHRLGVEWSRIEPHPGRFDEAAVDRYRAILTEARRLGLSTMVALNHFTLPLWAADAGAWTWRRLPARFESSARFCADRLGDLVDRWITFNEPGVLALAGYGARLWPPGLGRPDLMFAAMARMIMAHARARDAIRQRRPDAPVGLVFNMPLFEAHRPRHPLDRLAARLEDHAFNDLMLRALKTGTLPFPLARTPTRVRGLAGAFDFLGLNYYGRFASRFALMADTPISRHAQSPTTRTDWTDWGQPCPRGLTLQLLRLGKLGKPLFVTENGLFEDGDDRRPSFIVQHVRAVADAIALGADVRGYFFWTLVDNFEWAEGWSTPFGLFELDRDTGERRPRRSAHLYARICRDNGLSTETLDDFADALHDDTEG